MRTSILVTLDGSKLSEAVLPIVAELVAGTGQAVTLMRVGELPGGTLREPIRSVQPYVLLNVSPATLRFATGKPSYVETKTQAIDRREDELKAYLEEKTVALRGRGIKVETVVEFGNPAEKIIEYARRPEIGMVAMATHGHTGLRTLIFGSVASRVLYSGVRPVIMVRPHIHHLGWPAEILWKERPGSERLTRAGSESGR